MLEMFANPANMVIGGFLISSPILIHLINRMRYKRIRWAAMEFLLKSQKRNRKRLIVEQLILLLLRILLVLLAGLLLARFLGAANWLTGRSNFVHVVLLDDRMSMTDQWKQEGGERKNSWQTAREVIEKLIAKQASGNRSAQTLIVRRVSEPNVDLFNDRVTDESLKRLTTTLNEMPDCTRLHLDLSKAVAATRDVFGKHASDRRFLYIVSDFRQRHWGEPEATTLKHEFDTLRNNNVEIKPVDVANPKRPENAQQAPGYHDNLAIVDLRPDTRVAAQNTFVPFRVSVANYGAQEKQAVMVSIKVNGVEDFAAAQVLASVPPGRPTEATFQLSFRQPGFNQVTAHIDGKNPAVEDDRGLSVDNTRFAVIEVRKQVAILVLDGDGSAGERPGGDYFHLKTLFNAAKGFEVVRGVPSDLEGPDLLQKYASIYITNTRELSDKQVAGLEEYAKAGGGVGFFMGDRVTSADFYNKKLYRDGDGPFPVPLADQPTRPLTDEERNERFLQNIRDPQYQLFVRDDKHPAVAQVGKYKEAFKYLDIERYHPVPRQKWKFNPEDVKELVTLPNNRPLVDYVANVQDILKELSGLDERHTGFKPGLELHRNAVRQALRGKTLPPLSNALEAMLHDRGIVNDPERPSMEEFWQQPDPEVGKLRARVERMREAVQLGDPLVVARNFGKGRVVAVMTTAGRKWNNWAAGGPASFTFPVLMVEMQKYLSSIGGGEASLTVGGDRLFEVDAARFEPFMNVYYQGEAKNNEAVPAGAASEDIAKAGLEDFVQLPPLGKDREAPPEKSKDKDKDPEAPKENIVERMRFEYTKARKPGIYFFQFTRRGVEAEGQPRIDTRAFAFNVDTANESDLRRVTSTEREKVTGKVTEVNVDTTVATGRSTTEVVLSDKQSDLSESGWLYLLFLVILIVEQALAVHLSFHLKGSEMAPAAPAAATA
jgi:hypothetical protein